MKTSFFKFVKLIQTFLQESSSTTSPVAKDDRGKRSHKKSHKDKTGFIPGHLRGFPFSGLTRNKILFY